MSGGARESLTRRGVCAATASAVVLTLPLLAACSREPEAQNEICLTQETRLESGCRPGQRVVFMPRNWGNEQLPVTFAAMNCDLRYSVVMTNGAVTCIFLKARAPDAPERAASNAPSSGGR